MLKTPALVEALRAPIAIPIVPFRDGRPDMAGFCLNVRYLMEHNHLDEGRRRGISISSVSLLQHLVAKVQDCVVQKAGEVMGDAGVLISGVSPNPARNLINRVKVQSGFNRPPDAYLIMPVDGIADPAGVYNEFLRLANQLGEEFNARFLLYLRKSELAQTYMRLLAECKYIVGAQVGTDVKDVAAMVEEAGDKVIIWGKGDRCLRATDCGAGGFTSGIAGVFARMSDEMGSAQCRKDYAEMSRLECLIDLLEEIRSSHDHRYSYSAVVEAMRLGEFNDVVPGDGTAPFNPFVPLEVARRVEEAIVPLLQYH